MSVTSEVMDAGPSLSPGTARDYGDQALLLEFDSTADVLAWTATLTAAQLLGVVDIVPASRTILIKLADPRYQAPTRQRLGKLRLQPGSAPVRPIGQADVTIDVVYD
ncbi:carboxyltransferase domain-containing protein, partial [Streptomyces sp. NPDC056002]